MQPENRAEENQNRATDKPAIDWDSFVLPSERGQIRGGTGVEQGMTEKEAEYVKKSTLYDLRLIFSSGEKEQYTKAEILEMLDKIAKGQA